MSSPLSNRLEDPDGFDDALALANDAAVTSWPEPTPEPTPGPTAGPTRGPATGPNRDPGSRDRATACDWATARALARRAGRPLDSVELPLAEAVRHALAEPLAALTDLPGFDSSAMDGWAVAGPGPWVLESGRGLLAGGGAVPPLGDGRALAIATGARVPPGATAVLRSEHGRVVDGRLSAGRAPANGTDIRPRGQECRSGDLLLPAGTAVTPAVLGLAAAAGYDTLRVTRRPRVEVLVLGAELLGAGVPGGGLIRDALGPLLTPWLAAVGADVVAVRRLGDDGGRLAEAVAGSDADVLLTTGGTAAGPVDHVRPLLAERGARLLVDGVAVRPGHPMLLAELPADTPGPRHLVGLPGNPLAAVSGLLLLAEPLLRGYADLDPDAPPHSARVTEAVTGHPRDTRLVPVAFTPKGAAPLRYHGPAMLRGVAAADALAVIPPGGAPSGSHVVLLRMPSP
ncbi:molybdopterin molybdenumtransferase MoeA [Streptomyces durbertensis]|uniref:Molybdopterin molybdenumtransferase n=1 Tax=Streptomyces durbertensis TaxID=2448886 RepID=A0ABR6EFU6_9ACTN|nr:molybdopterin-binding protein [Streptomyces durbertensis]MBB1244209.1 molybdopterin molybdenumtransferase MoeA [Streptomyces durbertensis]